MHTHAVPALVCNNPEFMEGGITARWSYIHTGGQDLTSVLISYTYEEGGLPSTSTSVMNTDPTITSINVPRLTAGIRYTFNITAMNSIGSSHILCGPTLLESSKIFTTTAKCTHFTKLLDWVFIMILIAMLNYLMPNWCNMI